MNISADRYVFARIVVSYYAHPYLSELYSGWTVREVHTTKAMSSGNGKRGTIGAKVAPEVLLINGISFGRETFLYG